MLDSRGSRSAACQGAAGIHDGADRRVSPGKRGALRRVKRISNATIVEAAIRRDDARNRMVDELLAFLGGESRPVVARLIQTGKLTLDDVKEAERMLRRLARTDKAP